MDDFDPAIDALRTVQSPPQSGVELHTPQPTPPFDDDDDDEDEDKDRGSGGGNIDPDDDEGVSDDDDDDEDDTLWTASGRARDRAALGRPALE